jgi:hypothetical protein
MRSVTEDTTSCPCLMAPLASRGGEFPLPVYCRPGPRRVRVPSRDELAGLCTAGAYVDCPGYRRWMAAAAWEDV